MRFRRRIVVQTGFGGRLSFAGLAIASAMTAAVLPAEAAEARLIGTEVRTLITGHAVAGTDDGGPWTQDFAADGTTIHKQGAGQSTGIWDVRGDQYCSRWPPGEAWTCFDMARDGETIVFIAPGGKRYEAHFTH